MTYPGLVLLVGVGIGLATFLYYVFNENRQEEQHTYSRNGGPPEDRYEDRSWSISSHKAENTTFNRRSSSNSLKNKNGREPTTSKDDITYCSICQYALIESDVIQLYPCKHNFHKDCINKWRSFDPGASCPNCRREIKQAI
ncbi:E3 ubiquitin-protein ligase ZNRF4-like [Formica exsecta]|uniref:E3 ubiquitin-protein ligase ZNRF4-like n=1 Tax=Formica exsecta TaxID=72781 RepID=UPI001144C6A9|nr:E3 ubiquitin-protein ligase ZNRF4-like [Formica exsecta]